MQKKEDVPLGSPRLLTHFAEVPPRSTPLSTNHDPVSTSTPSPSPPPQKESDTQCNQEAKPTPSEACQWGSRNVPPSMQYPILRPENAARTTSSDDGRVFESETTTTEKGSKPPRFRLRRWSDHTPEEREDEPKRTVDTPPLQSGSTVRPINGMTRTTGGVEKTHAVRRQREAKEEKEETPSEWRGTADHPTEHQTSGPMPPALLPFPSGGTCPWDGVSLARGWRVAEKGTEECVDTQQEATMALDGSTEMEERWGEDEEELGVSVSVHVLGEGDVFPAALPTPHRLFSPPPRSAEPHTKAMSPSFMEECATGVCSAPSSSRDATGVVKEGKDPLPTRRTPTAAPNEKEEEKNKNSNRNHTNDGDASAIDEGVGQKHAGEEATSSDAALEDGLRPPFSTLSPPPPPPPSLVRGALPPNHTTASPSTSSSSSYPSLSLLLHLFTSLRERYSPITPPPLAFANVSPFVRVLCECYTPTGYCWGRVRVQRSPVMEGAVVVEVPGDAELRAISWWLGRTMKEAELDHYYGRLSGVGGGGLAAGKGDGLGGAEEEEGAYLTGGGGGGGGSRGGGGEGGRLSRSRYLPASTMAGSDPMGGGLTSCRWPSPSPVVGGDASGMEAGVGAGAGGGGGGAFGYGGVRGSAMRSGGVPMGHSLLSSAASRAGVSLYPPWDAHGLLPSDGGPLGNEEEEEGNDIFFSLCGEGVSPARGERRRRSRPLCGLGDSNGHGGLQEPAEGGTTPSRTAQATHLALSRLRSVSPSTARRLRRQRTREAYPSRMVHLICVGHERAKAMLAASSLSMMRSLRISKIELSLDYPPMLHQLGNVIWNRYMQLSKLELIATNCLGCSSLPSATSPPLLPRTASPLSRLRPPLVRGTEKEEEEEGVGGGGGHTPHRVMRSPSRRDVLARPPPTTTGTASLPSIPFPTDRASLARPLHRNGHLWREEENAGNQTKKNNNNEEERGDGGEAKTFLYPAESDLLRSSSQWRGPAASPAPLSSSFTLGERGGGGGGMSLSSTSAGKYVPHGDTLAGRSPPLLFHPSTCDVLCGKGNGGALRGLELLPLLRELNLSNSLLDGVGFLGKSKTLVTLNLSNTSISNPGLQGLQECVSLQVLILFQCPSITSVKCLTPLYHVGTIDRVPSVLSSSSSSGSSGATALLTGGMGGGNGEEKKLPIPPPPPPPPPMQLEMLDLRGTSVNSQGLMGLALLPRLRSLRLGRTKVTHLSPALSHAPALTHLDLENCTTLHPEEGLEGLFVEDGPGGRGGTTTAAGGRGGEHPPLQYLNLTRANVSSLAPLAHARTLQCVVASRVTSLAGRLLPEMFLTDAFGGSCLWSLTHFDLSHSPVDASHCMEVLIQCVNLQYVNLTRTQNLTRVDGLEQLQCLREVHLSHTAITSVNCFGNGAAPSLTHLNVSHTLLEDGGIRALPSAPCLTFLDLTDTQICHVGHLHACPSLKVLVLSSTLVSSSGLRGLEQSLTLEELYLNEALVKHFTTWDVEASAICPLRYAAPSWWLAEMKMANAKDDQDEEEEEEKEEEDEVEEGRRRRERGEKGWGSHPRRGQEGGHRPRGGEGAAWRPKPHTGCRPKRKGWGRPLRRLVPDAFVDGVVDGDEGEDESPAMQDARREAQLEQLWEVVESVALRYMSLRAAHSPPSSFSTFFPLFSSSSSSLASRSHRDDSPRQSDASVEHRTGVGMDRADNDTEDLAHGVGMSPHTSGVEEPPMALGGVASSIPLSHKTPLEVFLSHLREWRLEKVAAETHEERRHSASSLMDDPAEAKDATSMHGMAEESRGKGGDRRRRGSSPQGEMGAGGPKAPRLSPCSTIFYPSLWKLSISHTPHRSSGLIGILQLPRLVELDVSDTWIDSPLGLLFPFSAAVMESDARLLTAWREGDANEEEWKDELPPMTTSGPRMETTARTDRGGSGETVPPTEFPTDARGDRVTIPHIAQHAPLLWEVLQQCSSYPHCFSFLLHQRLRCLVMSDAKLQQTQFLHGVEYGQVLEYISVQSCQPSLSLMLGPSSMASLAACHALVTVDMSHTDLTSKEIWYLQQWKRATPSLVSSVASPVRHPSTTGPPSSARSTPLNGGKSRTNAAVGGRGHSSDGRRPMTAQSTHQTTCTRRSVETRTMFSSPSPSSSSSSSGAIAVSTASSSPFSSSPLGDTGDGVHSAREWETTCLADVDVPLQARHGERKEEEENQYRIASSAPPPPPREEGNQKKNTLQRAERGGKTNAFPPRSPKEWTLPLSVDSSHPSTSLHRKPTTKNAEEDGLKSSVGFSFVEENLSFAQEASAPHSTTSTSIASLHLSGTLVLDLSFLCFHRHIRVLQLSVTMVRDLSPLRYCRDLHLLDVSKTRVFDLRPLAPCKSLRYLFASDTFTTQTGIQHLPSLYHLEVVDLSGTPITSILLLRPLSQLRHLKIRNTAVPKAESKCFPPCTLIQQ